MNEKSTSQLMNILNHTKTTETEDFLAENSSSFLSSNRVFADYFREVTQKRSITLQDVFLRADIPERYGYKLISGEKHTRQRDLIIRMCLVGKLTTKETQHALKLYGLSELYPRIRRDAIIIIALNQRLNTIDEANALLLRHNMEPLVGCKGSE